MNKINLKNFYLNLVIILIVFIFDRTTKLYILKLAEVENSVDLYITSYLNLFLIWNKGIAFGLFSIDESIIYNSITILIGLIIVTILYMMLKNNNIQRYFFALIAGGALGNLYDRVVYTAVPDFIDLHFYGFHWFVFNVADIFITIGVFCLILVELFINNKNTNEKN
ncbi:signal peptidase II [Candidatus Pelagibacter sp.]|nr:signal peptidase II [Candidatus Pelagibacter sp.]MDB4011559.1 signal peptidase II [Candidatus Pelagibacter sp.]MDB9746175.1 signal peptidase II [Candidatus Pelagibacter sp.]MDC0516747.1 signal peptidase II [Candidatus Pelagibacter sp.]